MKSGKCEVGRLILVISEEIFRHDGKFL